jgi:hypothetical protein
MGDVRQEIQRILHSYPIGSRVNSEDAKFLLDILYNHPEADAKIGCGIKAFEVRKNTRYTNHRCFYIIRIDKSEDDFSTSKCLAYPNPLRVFKSICRALIGMQMYYLKTDYFRKHSDRGGFVQCPITEEWVTQDNAHIDHIPPVTFDKLVTDFINLYNIDVEKVELRESDVGKTFASIALADKWIAYHNKHAKLRVVSAHANLSIIKKL